MRTHKPTDRYTAMQLARDIEAEFLVLKGQDEDDTGSKGKGTSWVMKSGLGLGIWVVAVKLILGRPNFEAL